MEDIGSISAATTSADNFYQAAIKQWGPSLERLASAYEADIDKRRDLRQNIHFQLWRSFHHYDARCSLRTWTYRVAHHVGASHVLSERRTLSTLVSLEEFEAIPDKDQGQHAVERHLNLTRLSMLIRQLKPLDRQVIVCWLEGVDAESIGEITGLSPGNIAVRINRIKKILAGRFLERSGDES